MTETNESTMWKVHAGRSTAIFEQFAEKNCIAIGWGVGDLTGKSLEEIRVAYRAKYPDDSPVRTGLASNMLHKFTNFVEGEWVVSYGRETREYLVGTIGGDYRYNEGFIEDYPHIRPVQWKPLRVSRDLLSLAVKNTLGGLATIYQINPEAAEELRRLASEVSTPTSPTSGDDDEARSELEQIISDMENRANELIKDEIVKLSPKEMEKLAAAILRAVGYKTRLTGDGPDRGVDVFASPDGLGMKEPRIKTEVKHRRGPMDSDDIKKFVGGLRQGDRGLYISTGGSTKEARYEAERSDKPLTLLNLDDLVELVKANYENFDSEGRVLVPLIRLYWPKR